MVCHVFFSFMFSKINPEHRVRLLLSGADRWCNTTETQLKSSELLNKDTLFTQHHVSVLMPSVRVRLILVPKNTINNSTPKTLSDE